jgi:hypothetical protein
MSIDNGFTEAMESGCFRRDGNCITNAPEGAEMADWTKEEQYSAFALLDKRAKETGEITSDVVLQCEVTALREALEKVLAKGCDTQEANDAMGLLDRLKKAGTNG